MSALRRPGTRLALAAVVLLAVACGGDERPTAEPTVQTLTASPIPGTSREPAPDPSPSPSASASASATPTPTEDGTAPSGPTAADRARFVAAYRPEGASRLDHVSVDLDRDGVAELLFSYVVEGRTQVDIAWWGEEGYAIRSRGEGGSATLIDSVRVGDVNADGRVEVITFQRDDTGSSLTIWTVTSSRDLIGLRAVGGCDDGAYTYGVVGADLTDTDGDGVAEIVATCDDSPLPVRAWSEDTYRWDGEDYVADPRLAPSPTPTPTLPDEPSPSPTESEDDD